MLSKQSENRQDGTEKNDFGQRHGKRFGPFLFLGVPVERARIHTQDMEAPTMTVTENIVAGSRIGKLLKYLLYSAGRARWSIH